MVPMRYGGQYQPLDIGKYLTKILALVGRRFGQVTFEPAGFYLRKYRKILNIFEIVRNPIDDLIPVTAKILGGHIAQISDIFLHKL